MINKVTDSLAQAFSGIQDGAVVMIGGFGGSGIPHELIEGLVAQNAKDLVIITNNAGSGETGIAALLKSRRVRKIICSYPRMANSHIFETLYRSKEIELELTPQGNLAERIRAQGAGIGGFFTETAFGTLLAQGKETRLINGKNYVFESPLAADFALIKGFKGDRWGNLVYRKASRNFGPIMANYYAGYFCATCYPCRRTNMNQPSGVGLTLKPISRNEMAQKIASYIVEGTYVNLGIGMPTLVANYLPSDKEIFLHSENGILGMGPAPQDADIDWDLINAGKQPVTLLSGGSYFHQADSFAMMRGGHIDISVLGGFQVSQTGDLANWHTGEVDAVPAVGGAMDLAVGAKKTYVMMEHLTKDGKSKLVAQCTYPLTGIGCVSMVFTDLGVFEILPEGFFVVELFNGMSLVQVQAVTPVVLHTYP